MSVWYTEVFERALATPGMRRVISVMRSDDRDPLVVIAHFMDRSLCGRVYIFPDSFELVTRAMEQWRAGRPGEIGIIPTRGPTITVFVSRAGDDAALCFARLDPVTRAPAGKLTTLSMPEEIEALKRAISIATAKERAA